MDRWNVRTMVRTGRLLGLFIVAHWGVVVALTSSAHAEPNRERFLAYVARPVADTPLNRRWLSEIDRAPLLTALDAQWLAKGRDSGLGRLYATRLGQMAFAYRTPGTRWHRSAELLRQIVGAFAAFAQHQTDEGRFVWPEQQKYEYQAHEHVWRLEPLVMAYLWLEPDLSADQRAAWRKTLVRGGEYLLQKPLTEANNRGAVWAAGTTLCGLAFDDPRYFRLAQQHAPQIFAALIATSGEVIETQGGGGPDANYSYVGLAYAWWYRRLADARELDEPLRRAGRWFACYTNSGGRLLAPGSSTRKADSFGELSTLLPLWQSYAGDEPYFAVLAGAAAQDMPETFGRGGIIVSPLIWAMAETHADAPPAAPPAWFVHYSERYRWPLVDYFLAGREGYQTGVSLRGLFPLLGVQAWAARGRPALLHHDGRELAARSAIQTAGIDTSRAKLARRGDDWDVVLSPSKSEIQNGLTTIAYRQLGPDGSSLWTCIALTPQSTVIVCGPCGASTRSLWSLDAQALDGGELSGASWSHPTLGRIVAHSGDLKFNRTGSQPSLEITSAAPLHAVALSATSFEFTPSAATATTPATPVTISFRDGSGNYSLNLRDVLDASGQLNQAIGLRLERLK